MAPNTHSDAPEGQWTTARLIPSVGIRSSKEAEARATSSLFFALISSRYVWTGGDTFVFW